MADFNYREWADARKASGGSGNYNVPTPGNQALSWTDFNNKYNQVAAANRLLQNGDIDGTLNKGKGFRMNGGTEGLYNGKYRQANAPEWLFLQSLRGGEFLNNLPGEIAGFLGGDEAKEDWTFDANKFDLSNGLDLDDLSQVRNFVASIPGMIPGGILEGAGKMYEAVTGSPLQERRETDKGWEIADYTLDASQRAAAGIDAGINLLGTFTGGAGRVVGGVAKAGVKKSLTGASRELESLYAKGMSRADIAKDMELGGAATRKLASYGEDFKTASEKVSKAEQKMDILDGLSKGIVTRALETGTGGKALGTGVGLFADAGDEAVEEFVQSYADDIRMKNLDDESFGRALTGAAWGAAGGAIMGGGGRLLSHFSSVHNSNDVEMSTDASVNADPKDPYSELYDVTKDNWDSVRVNKAAQEAYENKTRAKSLAPASTTVVQSKPDNSKKMNEMGMGADHIKKMYFRSGAKGRDAQILADAFQVTTQELTDAIETEPNFAAWVQNRINELAARGKKVRLIFSRNPDTKNGAFYINLTEVWEGSGFSCRPEVVALVGSDWDSDRCSIFFDTASRLKEELVDSYGMQIEPKGYASSLLYDPEMGSNLDWSLAGITTDTKIGNAKGEKALGIMHRILKDLLDNDPSHKDYDLNGKMVTEYEYFKQKIIDAFNNDYSDMDEKSEAISKVFHELRERRDERWKKERATNPGFKSGDNVLEEIHWRMFNSTDVLFNRVADNAIRGSLKAFRAARDLGAERQEYIGADENAPIVDKGEPILDWDWDTHGTTGGLKTPVAVYDQMGHIYYLENTDGKGNPLFRMFGSLKFAISSSPLMRDAVQKLAEYSAADKTNVVLGLIRKSFNMNSSGTHPSIAIEGTCDDFFLTELLSEVLIGSPITDDNIESFVKAFIEKQSAYSRMYNMAQAKLSTRGFDIDEYQSPYKSPLDGHNEKLGENDVIPDRNDKKIDKEYTGSLALTGSDSVGPAFFRNVTRLLENYPMMDLLGRETCLSLGIESDQETLGQFVERANSKIGSAGLSVILSGIKADKPKVAAFIAGCVNSYAGEMSGIEAAVRQEFSQIKAPGFRERYIKNGNKVDARDMPVVIEFFEWVYKVIGDDAINLGLFYTDKFFETEIGQEVMRGFDGETDVLINVVAKMSIRAQMTPAIAKFLDPDEEISRDGEDELKQLALISPLHETIVWGLLEGRSRVFEWATDISVPLDSTIRQLDEVSPYDKTQNFIVNAFQTETGKFGLSSVSSKFKQARILSSEIARLSYDNMIGEVNFFFENTFKGEPEGAFDDFAQLQARGSVLAVQKDLIAAEIVQSMYIENSQSEKATIPDVLTGLYGEEELQRAGGLKSVLRRITDYNKTVTTKSDWQNNREHILACMTDPDYRYWVWDEDQRARVPVSRDTLFREVNENWEDGQKPTNEDYRALFTKYPQFATYLCDSVSEVSMKNGMVVVKPKRTQDLTSAYISFQKPMRTTDNNALIEETTNLREVRRALRNVRALLSTREETSLIVAAMAAKRLDRPYDGGVKIEEVADVINECIADLAENLYYVINSRSIDDFLLDLETSSAEELEGQVAGFFKLAFEQEGLEAESAMSSQALSVALEKAAARNITSIIAQESDLDISSLKDKISHKMANARSLLALKDKIFDGMVFLVKEEAKATKKTWAKTMRDNISQDTLEEEIVSALKKHPQGANLGEEELQDLALEIAVSALDSIGDNANVEQALSTDESPYIASEDLFSLANMPVESRGPALDSLSRKIAEATNSSVHDTRIKLEKTLEIISSSPESEIVARSEANAINKKIFDASLEYLAKTTNLRINANAAQQRDFLNEKMRGLLEFLQTEASKEENRAFGIKASNPKQVEDGLKQLHGTSSIPVYSPPPIAFDYTDRTTQTLSTILQTQLPASGNETKVGVGGSDQPKATPLSLIPQKVSDTSEKTYSFYRSMTAKEIEESDLLYDGRYSGVTAIIENDEGEKTVKVGSEEFKKEYTRIRNHKRQTGEDLTIKIYHPNENAHGLPTLNMLSAPGLDLGEQHHRISAIYQNFIQYSMEALVLKYKKKLDVEGNIGETFKIETKANRSRMILEGSPDYMDIRDRFRDIRKAFTEDLTAELTDSEGKLKSLKYGRDQARIMVQSLTPGALVDIKYEVEITDTDGETKTEQRFAKRFLDSSLFMGDPNIEGFEQWKKSVSAGLQGELRNGTIIGEPEITSAEFIVLEFDELNSRIIDKVDELGPDDRKNDVAKAEAKALEAVSDYSDYWRKCSGSAHGIFSGVVPIAYTSRPKKIPLSASPSPELMIYGMVSGGIKGINLDVAPGSSDIIVPYPAFPTSSTSSAVASLKAANDSFWGNEMSKSAPGDAIITSVIVSDRDLKRGEIKTTDQDYKFWNSVSSLKRSCDELRAREGQYSGAVFLASVDNDKVTEAINFASKTQSPIIVRAKDLKENPILAALASHSGDFKASSRTGEVLCYLSVNAFVRQMFLRSIVPSPSKRTIIPSEHLPATLIYDPSTELSNGETGVFFGTLGDGSGMVFKSGQSKMMLVPRETTKIPIDDVIPNEYRTFSDVRPIKKEEAQALLDRVAEKRNGQWRPIRGEDGQVDFSLWTDPSNGRPVLLNTPYLKNIIRANHLGKDGEEIVIDIIKYLASYIERGNGETGLLSNEDIRADSVAMLVCSNGYISPVMTDSSMPRTIRHFSAEVGSGEIELSYSGYTNLGEYADEQGRNKGALKPGEIADKFMMFNAPLDSSGNDVEFAFMDSNGKEHLLQYAQHIETVKSRVYDIDAPLLSDNLHYGMVLMDTATLFFEQQKQDDGGTSYAPKQWILENWPTEDITNLLSGRQHLVAKKIANGTLTLFPESEDKRNTLIKNIFNRLIKTDADVCNVFGTYRLERDPKTGGYIRRTYTDPNIPDSVKIYDHRKALGDVVRSKEDLLLLYNSIHPRLCPESTDAYWEEVDQVKNEQGCSEDRAEVIVSSRYMFNPYGKTVIKRKLPSSQESGTNTLLYLEQVYLGDVRNLGVEVPNLAIPNAASIGDQKITARTAFIGQTDRTLKRSIDISNRALGNNAEIASQIHEVVEERKHPKKRKDSATRDLSPELDVDMKMSLKLPYLSKAGKRELKACLELDDKTFGRPRYFYVKENETDKDDVSKNMVTLNKLRTGGSKKYSSFNTYDTARESLSSAGYPQVSFETVDILLKCLEGTTWGDNVLREPEVWALGDAEYSRYVGEMKRNVEERGLFVVAHSQGSPDLDGRFSRCLLPKGTTDILWAQNVAGIKDWWESRGKTKSDFIKAMKEEQLVEENVYSSVIINRGAGAAKYNALARMSQAAWFSWDEGSRLTPIDGKITWAEMLEAVDNLGSILVQAGDMTEEERQAFKALVEAEDEDLKRVNKYAAERHVKTIKYSTDGNERTISFQRIQEAKALVNTLNNAAELSKVMALLNPLITAGNLMDRARGQGMTRFAIWLTNKFRLPSPYSAQKSHIVNKEVRDYSVESAQGQALYGAFRDAELKSEDMEMLSALIDSGKVEEAIAFIQEKDASSKTILGRTWGTVRDFGYKMGNGFSLGLKSQMKLIVDLFVTFVEEDPVQSRFWFAEVKDQTDPEGKTYTRLELTLRQGGFEGFMMTCLAKGSISRTSFLRACNSAKRGDMAQKNAGGLIMTDICKKIPFSNFIVTTMISKFPQYGFNVTGRVASLILPMASLTWSFNETLAKTEYGKNLGIKNIQVHASLRRAVLADLCRFGAIGLALILANGAGLLEPPEDERKWGDTGEWLFCGQRVSASWWVEDTLSMVLPLACFWKACDYGQPRLDILTNGFSNLCYANPVLRCGDIAEWLMNPTESLFSTHEEDVKQFQNAKGGPPDFWQSVQANAFNGFWSWAAQFVTPSIIKEWYRSSEPLEKSYKRTWKRSASGAIVSDGREGATEFFTYDEAMKHKLTQRNPVLAWLFSAWNADDSYLLSNMPNTVMYDDFQLAATHGSSVAGLSGAEREAKVVDIIAMLQGIEDIDKFVEETGFHLDYETLMAVSSEVWDMYHAVDEYYYELKASGQLDYNVMGNGDWSEGKRLVGEIEQWRSQTKQYWYNFYYRKLKDTAIGKQIVLYNRYNTTYRTDVNGDVYATGVRRSPMNILPFTSAPGNINDPEGTAGYSNDFASISAVTGLPLDSRALIPVESGAFELPDFESLSEDGNGDSYSSSYNNRGGSGSGVTSAATTSTSYPRSSGGSGGSGGSGSGGGGGYRSSAGGFYAPSVSLPRANSSRIMNTDRAIKPNYDYLRPDFETKGSREAYRRSDI